ncbi:MAG: glycosyl transferase family 1 [Anaerolineaceae bacterium 4572_32.1]|nr:MAG: glycosyl transferase family 1 [Anaerolineaceae bacterium 4572_32.1]
MRVLMISKACVVGIYQTKLEELARRPGVELAVVVPPSWRDERGALVLERAHTTGYDLIETPIAFNGHFHLHFYPQLGKLLRRFQPHILHIDEEPYNLAAFQAMRLAQRIGARTLLFTWQNLHRSYPPPFSWMESYNLCRADYVLAGNKEAEAVMRAKGYAGPVAAIPQFGVDPDVFAPRSAQGGATFIIGYVGRLVEAKGVETLLRAVAGLRIESEWRLHLIGSGPLEEHLRRLASELGVSGRVRFEGQLPSTEMPARLRALNTLVLPSLTRSNWKEQFGRVLIEAMACGVAVIGSDSGEIPHVIGDAGLIFPEGNVEALRDQLVQLADNDNLRAELAARGRARVLARYTQARIAEATYSVYRQILTA